MYCKECVERNKSLSNNNVFNNNLSNLQGANVCYKHCAFCGRIIDSSVDVCNFCLQNDFNSDKYREKRNNLNSIRNVFITISVIILLISLTFLFKNDTDEVIWIIVWGISFFVPSVVIVSLLCFFYSLIKKSTNSANSHENAAIIKNLIYIGLILLVGVLILVGISYF